MSEYDMMNQEQLENELVKLKEFLSEVIEEREMMFSTTGIHRSLQYYVIKYETEINEIQEKINRISALLGIQVDESPT